MAGLYMLPAGVWRCVLSAQRKMTGGAQVRERARLGNLRTMQVGSGPKEQGPMTDKDEARKVTIMKRCEGGEKTEDRIISDGLKWRSVAPAPRRRSRGTAHAGPAEEGAR